MSAATWIIFGPDLEPLERDSRRRADAPEARRDGLLVAGEAEAVARALADAERSHGGWCRLERADAEGAGRPVHVQARHVRYVLDP